jgi:hypothetical protein
MSFDRLLTVARKSGGSERGLIVITADNSAISRFASDSQILVLNASDL